MADETEVKAREMGWVPKEEFKGNEEKWVDASTFVERGEHVLPILQATNKRQREEMTALRSQVNSQEEALRAARETIGALEEYHSQDVKRKVEEARKGLKTELAAANERGDHAAVAELTDQMVQLNTSETQRVEQDKRDKASLKDGGATKVDATQHPDFIAFKQENPWYGEDVIKTGLAHEIGTRLTLSGTTLRGKAFFDKVVEETNKELAKAGIGGKSNVSKVEGGGASGGGTHGGGGKSYRDLPADAKAACDGFTDRLVGKGRKYATKADWQAAYAKDYFAEI